MRDENFVSGLHAKDENELLSLRDTHYFCSTVCLSFNDMELNKMAVEKIRIHFSVISKTEIHRYILTNWYDDINWKLLGRRHPTKVAITRTTMKVEAHWSIMK